MLRLQAQGVSHGFMSVTEHKGQRSELFCSLPFIPKQSSGKTFSKEITLRRDEIGTFLVEKGKRN